MLYKGYNDYELIYMVRENDDSSRGILYDKYSSILKNIAYEYYCKFKNYGYDYEDFLQEAYISFEKSIINYDENSGVLLYTFVTVCVKRALISFCRLISNEKYNVSGENVVPIDDVPISDYKSDVEGILEYYDLEDKIKDIMYGLPIEIGCIMELRLNNFTFYEISSLLDISVSTVEFRNRKVKRELKNLLSYLR